MFIHPFNKYSLSDSTILSAGFQEGKDKQCLCSRERAHTEGKHTQWEETHSRPAQNDNHTWAVVIKETKEVSWV